jgi:hypothetical protein
MSRKHRHRDRARIELWCLLRALIPMPDDNGRLAAKVVAVNVVTAWSVVTVALTLEGVATVAPPFYGIFTAIVFLLVGRLWNLEVEALLPGGK